MTAGSFIDLTRIVLGKRTIQYHPLNQAKFAPLLTTGKGIKEPFLLTILSQANYSSW